ncbi:hypothetical protein L7F22_006999 [Adiantum nelumboides]|nr:hypothetical protein [Adiantum nelumboides]
MNVLPSESLLNVFQQLDSDQMVRLNRVCKGWYEVIEENKMLWRRLVLDQDKKEGWNSSLIKLFDRKCGSRLKEVSIKVKFDQQTDVPLLDGSSKRTKRLFYRFGFIHLPKPNLSELSLTLPHLVQCRIGDVKSETVHLIERENLEEHSQAVGNSSNLRVLWIDNAALFQKVGSSENLVSLWIEGLWDSSQWRGCLEKSQNLKHLRIKLRQSPIDSLVAPIHLHQLEVLELFLLSTEYPSWLIIPSTSTIILHSYQIPQGLPSISKLWIAEFDDLVDEAPEETAEELIEVAELEAAADDNEAIPFPTELVV